MTPLQQDIFSNARHIGTETLSNRLFDELFVRQDKRSSLLSSLLCGHHLLVVGPPGSGKTAVISNLSAMLDDIEVIEGCPVRCSPQSPSCPWCLERQSQGESLQSIILPAKERMVKIQGSAGLVVEDLIGDLYPEAVFTHGIQSPNAFLPGKLLRANRGILVIDFIDRVPERVLNAVMYALEGGAISIGALEQRIELDMLVVATGSELALKTLPLDLIDFFDVITMGYVHNFEEQKEITLNYSSLPETSINQVIDIVNKTREHHEVERGVSTRGMIKYAELLDSLSQVEDKPEDAILRYGAMVSLPHRLTLRPEVDVAGKRDQIVSEILDKTTGIELKKDETVTLSKDDLLALVDEIASEEKLRRPLKYGAFDLLLKRIRRFPESQLARLHGEMMERLGELYPERHGTDNITEELLAEIDVENKAKEKIRQAMEKEALKRTLNLLEQEDILERSKTGWRLSQKGITLLLERLTPRLDEAGNIYGYGKHSAGKKLAFGEGRIIGTRHFRFGDRYRDVSLKDTIRETIRNRREVITREDIKVTTKDIRTRMDIVLAIDLSGTMNQLQKLWFAKESAIALSLAASRYGDRVGVVSFSNLGEVVVDLTSSAHRVTQRVIDLDLRENSFTNIGYGLLKSYELLEHHPKGKAKQHIILISDGDATAPHPSPQKFALQQAGKVVRREITISCVCISQESSDPELMSKIAKIGKGRSYLVGIDKLASTLVQEAGNARD